MPRSSNQKLKLLYIAKILLEKTDDNHIMSSQDIVNALATYDVPAIRKTIYDDIEYLRQYGMDIELKRGNEGGYFVASRDFELPELKLLVDAVQSSRLITGKKSNELIQKLSKLTSAAQAKQLKRHIYINGRAKALNETVYYSIDAIHAAINEGRKISFKYFDYNTRKKRIYRRNDKPYIRTPIAMCWNEDKYYLLTYNPAYEDAYATYRVDRMANVEILDEKADKYDKKTFSVAEYIRKTFGMYAGETVLAKIAFHESLVSVVLDHFGSDTQMTDIGGNRFSINVEVSNSPVFLGWIFQLGDKVEIIEPENLRSAMCDMLDTGSGIYGKRA